MTSVRVEPTRAGGDADEPHCDLSMLSTQRVRVEGHHVLVAHLLGCGFRIDEVENVRVERREAVVAHLLER